MRVTEHFQNFLIVSFSYITAYSLTLGFVYPLQQMLLSNVILEVSLLFLPHGIRVLSFWFFGWRAVIYLLPAAYLMMVLSAQAGISLDIWSPLGSILACLLGFLFAKAVFPDFASKRGMPNWKYFAIIALFSSLFNSVGLTALHERELNFLIATGYVIGDMAGFFVCFLILIYAFRFARLLANANGA